MFAATMREPNHSCGHCEDSYRTIVDQVPMGVLVQREERIVYANGAALDCLGFSRESDLVGRGLYQLMRSKGVNIRVAKQRIGARSGTPEECLLLGEKRGSPVLTMERAAHDDSGRAVEWGRHAYRASQYSFEVTLVEH